MRRRLLLIIVAIVGADCATSQTVSETATTWPARDTLKGSEVTFNGRDDGAWIIHLAAGLLLERARVLHDGDIETTLILTADDDRFCIRMVVDRAENVSVQELGEAIERIERVRRKVDVKPFRINVRPERSRVEQ